MNNAPRAAAVIPPSMPMTHTPLDIRLLAWGGPEHAQALRLRDEVLRGPLGLRLADEDLSAERGDAHVGAFRGGEMVGTLVLSDRGDHLRMRQVAVAEQARGAGVGTLMVRFAEALARERGFRRMELHARRSAVAFYVRNGYGGVGEEFEEIGLPHLGMVKELA